MFNDPFLNTLLRPREPQLKPGSVSVSKTFTAESTNGLVKSTFKVSKGYQYVSILIGVIKDGQVPDQKFLAGELTALGYYPGDTLKEFLGEKKTKEFANWLVKRIETEAKKANAAREKELKPAVKKKASKKK